MMRITHSLFALAACAAGLPLAAHGAPPKAAPRPAVILDSSNRYSLDDAVKRPDGGKVLVLKLRLAGGGGKTWVTENCNPVMPVIDGNPVPLKQCLTKFYDKTILRRGRGESLTLEWPLDSSAAPLVPGQNYRLSVSLATDCTRTGGPGLYAMGDCKTTRMVQSPVFRIKAETAPPSQPVVTLDRGNRYSLAAAVTRPDGSRVLIIRLRLSGGVGKTWVTESCNPMVPVVDGRPVAINQCFTNFYSKKLLDHGTGETQSYDWPVDSPLAPLKAGRSYQLGVALATDCERSNGPGLYAMGDCKTSLLARSPTFTMTE